MLRQVFSLAIALTILATVFCSESRAQQASSGDEQAEDRTGTISGQVVNDAGRPLASASVVVRPFGAGGQVRNTTTDREGNFQVTNLDRAAYMVSASWPAHVQASRDPDSSQPTYYRVGDWVRLELVKGGVISGTVTTAPGEPVVGVHVRAYLIRDANGQPLRYGTLFRGRTTDDRGVYRIYGLAPGTYVVSAGGSAGFSGPGNLYESDVPTYAPSSTRDGASEITVRFGQESDNIDIRYRGEPGHVISGIASGPESSGVSGINIRLSSVFNGESQANSFLFQPLGNPGFVFRGVADGEYDLIADMFHPGGEWSVSEPRRVKVRGANVTGIELIVRPLGSISGRVALDESKAPECKGKRRLLFVETVVSAWHNEKKAARDQPQAVWSLGAPTLPDKQGNFVLRNLAPGQYRFNTRSLAKYWYLHSITLPAPAANAALATRLIDAARNWTIVKPGARISGLTITFAEGAASFHGQIKVPEGQRLPPKIFIYLVPADRDKAEDVLRFFAQKVDADGAFALNNLSPGRYWVIARAVAESESNVLSRLRLPDETDARAKLRQEAEAAGTEMELMPCQNVTGYELVLDPFAKIPDLK